MNCPTMRHKLVTSFALDMQTGEKVNTSSIWIDEPCGCPIFDRNRKVCRSCENGWESPNNYPIEAKGT